MTVLALAARLANKLAFAVFHRLANGFAVSHLRLANVGFNAEFALHAVDNDFKVQLTHAGNQGLTGFFVGLDAERRIFLRQTLQGNAHLFLIRLGLGLHGLRDHRLREHHAFQHDDRARIAQRFTGRHVFQTDAGGDVASTNFADFFTVVRVHLHNPADPLFLAANRIEDTVALAQNTRVDAHEGQLTHKRVGHQLERQRRELLTIICLAANWRLVLIHTFDRRNINRRRHEFDHRVEHALNALVLERGTTQHRLDFAGDGPRANAQFDFVFRQVTFFDVLVHELFGGFSRSFDHLLAPLLG